MINKKSSPKAIFLFPAITIAAIAIGFVVYYAGITSQAGKTEICNYPVEINEDIDNKRLSGRTIRSMIETLPEKDMPILVHTFAMQEKVDSLPQEYIVRVDGLIVDTEENTEIDKDVVFLNYGIQLDGELSFGESVTFTGTLITDENNTNVENITNKESAEYLNSTSKFVCRRIKDESGNTIGMIAYEQYSYQ